MTSKPELSVSEESPSLPSEGRRSVLRLLLRDLRIFAPSLVLFLAPLLLSPLAVYSGQPGKCAFVILLMSVFWLAEVAPLGIVSLLPLIFFPLLSIMPIKATALTYMSDTTVMLMSSLLVSLAVEESGLHRRCALRLLRVVGARPHMLLAGFMMVTAFMSLWLSDTATAALMVPIASALLESVMAGRLRGHKKSDDMELAKSDGEGEKEIERRSSSFDFSLLSPRDLAISKCVMITIAHASLIGGTGMINATGPNLVLRQQMQEHISGASISYFEWARFAIPPLPFYMFASWFLVQLQFLGPRHLLSIFRKSTEAERKEELIVQETVRREYQRLGPMSWAEMSTLSWFLLLILLWLTSKPDFVPGWTAFFPRGMVSDSVPAMLISFILFTFPRCPPDFFFLRNDRDRPSRRSSSLLTWDVVQKRFSWLVLKVNSPSSRFKYDYFIRDKGGQALNSGLADQIVDWMKHFMEGLSPVIIQALVIVLTVCVTEFSSNVSTASVFAPIALQFASDIGLHPLYLALPVAISCSFSFMLPMATPPNAIVYGTKTMTMTEMASCGILVNVACMLITLLNMNTWTYWLFDMSDSSRFIYRNGTTSH